MKEYKYLLLMVLCLVYFVFYSGRNIERPGFFKPATNDHYNFIAINEVYMWVSNNGEGSHDPYTNGSGFYWPGGRSAKKAAIWKDGLLWGGIINGDTVVNGNLFRQGLQAGKILSPGIADDPDNPRYRVYKIRKDWEYIPVGIERDTYERDYQEWPVEDGAPWVDIDGDGIFSREIDQTKFIGDEVLWYVSNDMDTIRSRRTYGSDPIGLEIQTTVWGYNKKNFLGDVVFKKYQLINKGHLTIDSMHLAYWVDNDLGDANDDFVGCDTLLNLAYCYNGDNEDGDGSGIQYGPNPPAVGHMFIQGPVVQSTSSDSAKYKGKWLKGYKNLPLTSFIFYERWPDYVDPHFGKQGGIHVYNNMTSRFWNGNPIIDPYIGLPVKFALPGDPVNDIGWYEGPGWPGGLYPEDRRFLMSSGPFTMVPGDTQEVVIAILMARGEDHIDSITELKKACRSVQAAYDLDFDTTPSIEKPSVKTVTDDQQITLYWEPTIENYDKVDPILTHQALDDSTYSFEGYRIWQFRDDIGSDPRVVATYDIKNDVNVIYEWQPVDGFLTYVPEIKGANEGLRRTHTITDNSYDQQPLDNANPYYFAVTAYAYSEHSDPAYVESAPEIIEINPGLRGIDQSPSYDSGEMVIADQISGNSDGRVKLLIVDPDRLSGNEYRVTFEDNEDGSSYSFINHSTGDTLWADCTSYVIDTIGAPVIDGFKLIVHNEGLEKIEPSGNVYGLKNVVEVLSSDEGDVVDVFDQYNSTGKWKISSYLHDISPEYVPDLMQQLNINDAIGYHHYEIRFTSSGSEYYLTGSNLGFQPWRADDPKATDRVPFEIWDVGRGDSDDDDFRLTIKTNDDYASIEGDSNRVNQDGQWSRLENGDWEPIFAFFIDSTYQEPLPEQSGRITEVTDSRIGRIVISGELPVEGTIIRITTWKPFTSEDIFSVVATAPDREDYTAAKDRLDDISVFPNPFFGTALYSGYAEQNFVRFTNLPTAVTLRIFSLGGTYVRRFDKNDDTPWLDWDLKNNAGEQVASGVYIAHLEMPNIGEKVMKIAVILENQR